MTADVPAVVLLLGSGGTRGGRAAEGRVTEGGTASCRGVHATVELINAGEVYARPWRYFVWNGRKAVKMNTGRTRTFESRERTNT